MKIIVYTIDHVRLEFEGPEIDGQTTDNGSLIISKWETENQKGSTVFAKGAWLYVTYGEDAEK